MEQISTDHGRENDGKDGTNLTNSLLLVNNLVEWLQQLSVIVLVKVILTGDFNAMCLKDVRANCLCASLLRTRFIS